MSILHCNGVDFETLNINQNLRIVMQKEFVPIFRVEILHKMIEKIILNIKRVLSVLIYYPCEPIFTFYVIQNGELFQQFSGQSFTKGICGLKGNPTALLIDTESFFSQYVKTSDIGLVHELAHIIHGYFFSNLFPISEGFAEVFPYYILDMEDDDELHKYVLRKLSIGEILTIQEIRNEGMFAKLEGIKFPVQYMKSYISMYLFMRGYFFRLENLYNINKFDALNLLLSEFREVDKLSTFEAKMNYVASLIDLPNNDFMYSKEIQMQALANIF